MRPLKPIIVCCLLFSALLLQPIGCRAEMVVGTVLEVDHAGEILTLRPAGNGDTTILRVRVRTPLPSCVRPGNLIRVWGAFGPGGKLFTATDIRGPGRGVNRDPTGARFRLQRSLGRAMHRGPNSRRR